MRKPKGGAFCEAYGLNSRNLVLEYLFENSELDFAVSDMAREVGLSKPKAYEIIAGFEKKGFVRKTRIIGKTQLYLLNKKNSMVLMLLKNFRECLRLIADEYSPKSSATHQSSQGTGIAYAKQH